MNFSVDPEFVNPLGGNYRLRNTGPNVSPLINAGSNGLIGPDIVDIDKDFNFVEPLPRAITPAIPRILTVVDIGAYERN